MSKRKFNLEDSSYSTPQKTPKTEHNISPANQENINPNELLIVEGHQFHMLGPIPQGHPISPPPMLGTPDSAIHGQFNPDNHINLQQDEAPHAIALFQEDDDLQQLLENPHDFFNDIQEALDVVGHQEVQNAPAPHALFQQALPLPDQNALADNPDLDNFPEYMFHTPQQEHQQQQEFQTPAAAGLAMLPPVNNAANNNHAANLGPVAQELFIEEAELPNHAAQQLFPVTPIAGNNAPVNEEADNDDLNDIYNIFNYDFAQAVLSPLVLGLLANQVNAYGNGCNIIGDFE